MIKSPLYTLTSLFLVLLTLIPAVPVRASGDPLLELIRILHDKGTLSGEEYRLLRQAAETDRNNREPAATADTSASHNHPRAPVMVTRENPEIAAQDNSYKWRIGGRLHADAIAFNSDIRDAGSGTQIRRARIGITGTFRKDWQAKFEYDFTGSGRGGIRDAYLRWSGQIPVAVTAGHFKVPFSLEEMASTNDFPFMERSLANAPVASLLSRQVGIGVSARIRDTMTLSGMVYSTGGAAAPGGDVDEGYGAGGRATFAPINKPGRLVHLGLGGAYLNAAQNLKTPAFSSRPETGFGLNILETGSLGSATGPVKGISLLGLEGAVMYGPLSLEGEYILTDVTRRALADADFSGFYIQGSYLLTGESRRYNLNKGALSGPRPATVFGQGGIGAWELAMRFSRLDLNDGTVSGGRADDLTIGVNWYPLNNIRFMANYVSVLDVTGGPFANDTPGAFLLRMQTHW